MIDTVAKVKAYLIADTGSTLYGLTGTRIWSPIAQDNFTNTAAAIVYHVASEKPHASGSTYTTQVTFKCYGGSNSFTTARTVYRALYDRLHAKGSYSNSILRAWQVTASQSLLDPDTGWPYVLATYQVIFYR